MAMQTTSKLCLRLNIGPDWEKEWYIFFMMFFQIYCTHVLKIKIKEGKREGEKSEGKNPESSPPITATLETGNGVELK